MTGIQIQPPPPQPFTQVTVQDLYERELIDPIQLELIRSLKTID